MTTHFITAEINLQESPQQLHQEIESELQKRGELLRWAITQIDEEQQIAHVEAVVTTQAAVDAAVNS
jgi:ribosomal protein S6